MTDLWYYEHAVQEQGFELICGVDEAGRGRGLAGDTAVGVLLENRVEHRVGDLVADLIGMTLGHRFGSK